MTQFPTAVGEAGRETPSGDRTLVLNMGPQHPSTHGVLRLVLERCEALDLYVRGPRRDLKAHLVWLVGRLAESYEERQLPRVAL